MRAWLGEVFAIEADNRRARRLFALAHHRRPRLQLLNQLLPLSGVGEQRAGGFHEDRAARVPEIGGARGSYISLLIDLAGEQFRVEAGMQHDAGLGAARVAQQEIDRQLADARALLQLGGGELVFGLVDEQRNLIVAGSRGFAGFGRESLASFSFAE